LPTRRKRMCTANLSNVLLKWAVGNAREGQVYGQSGSRV
jgi:hypothetical protein